MSSQHRVVAVDFVRAVFHRHTTASEFFYAAYTLTFETPSCQFKHYCGIDENELIRILVHLVHPVNSEEVLWDYC